MLTAIACGLAGLGGLFGPIDRYEQNLHFRHFNSLPADDRIVLIDIDDYALERIGTWPWPRRYHADLIRTLSDLGAGQIAMDIAFVDPATPRVEHADLSRFGEVEDVLGDRRDDRIIYDDKELAVAIREAENVYLAMLFDVVSPTPISSYFHGFGSEYLPLLPAGMGVRYGEASTDNIGFHKIAKDELTFNTSFLTPSQLAEIHSFCKFLPRRDQLLEFASRIEAWSFIERMPNPTWKAYEEYLRSRTNPRLSDTVIERQRVRYRRSYALWSALQRCTSAAFPRRMCYGYNAAAPLESLSTECKGLGGVVYDRDRLEGVVREAPFVVEVGNHFVPTLGLLAAGESVGADWNRIRWVGGAIEIPTDDGVWRIPVSKEGLSLIHWHVPETGKWSDSFRHIPVMRVLRIPLMERAISANKRAYRLRLGRLVELRHEQTYASYVDYARLVRQRNVLLQEADLPVERHPDPATLDVQDTARYEKLTGAIDAMEYEAIEWVEYQYNQWKGIEPQTPAEAGLKRQYEELHRDFVDGALQIKVEESNANLRARLMQAKDEMRALLNGKLCFVGYVATAGADMISTPVYNNVPGVMVHANIANTAFANRFVDRANNWVTFVFLTSSGFVIALLASWRGPVFGLLSLILIVFGLYAIGGGMFRQFDLHLPAWSASTTVLCSWAVVTLHRQATEERAKRRMRKALSQYTSPAIARRIAGSVHDSHFAAQDADVTCFFCDLYGFTGMSEKLGAKPTKQLLNNYLRAVSDLLIEHGAMVNKFVGDGVFAFFDAPIWPCEDRARCACESALRIRERVAALTQFWPGHDLSVHRVRIGLSTGPVFIGDYGSDAKLDYTCIGDTVNVGARLETANKTFGSSILVDARTKNEAGRSFLFRPLGQLSVRGRNQTIEAYELIGRVEDADEKMVNRVQRFCEAMEMLREGDVAGSQKVLEKLDLPSHPDPVARFFFEQAERLISDLQDGKESGPVVIHIE